MYRRLTGLVVFRQLLQDPVVAACREMLSARAGGDGAAVSAACAGFEAALFQSSDSWSRYLREAVLESENVCIRGQAVGRTPVLQESLRRELAFFDQLSQLLGGADSVLLAMGNSDVPVGQYTLKIFDYYGLSVADMEAAGKLTYGSDVKEVTTQVSEGAVDCGIIYATDAFSAGLTVVDSATGEMCGQVIYPAAVLKAGRTEQAQALLDYLQTDAAMAVFESVGFSPAF